MHLSTKTWSSLTSLELLIIPIGSCEQHGPHLPLATDSILAQHVADRVVARLLELGTQSCVAPLLPYGASDEHLGFQGTLSIGARALEEVVVALVCSIDGWSKRVLILNGHGGNNEALSSACRRLLSDGFDVAWSTCPNGDGDAHAGHTETSAMLAVDESLVLDFDSITGETAPLSEIMGRLRQEGVKAVSPSGVLGDPRNANTKDGRAFINSCTEALVSRIQYWNRDAHGRLLARNPEPS